MRNDATDNYPTLPPEADISIVELANTVLRNWRVVALLPVLFALLAGVWVLTRDRTYEATASFMPQVVESRAAGSAAALAQQFGVSLGAERSGQSPQLYLDLLRSKTLLRQAVETEYQLITDEGGAWSGTLIEYWNLNEEDAGTSPWHRATDILSDAIAVSVSRETGVVRLSVSSDNPVLTERIAARLLELLNEFNLNVRQTRAQEEGRFISSRITEAQADLLGAEGALQEFLRQNREFRNSPELLFEHDRLQRQVAMRQEVYASLVRAREQARIDAVRDIPLFTVIDHPAGSAEPESRGAVRRVVVAFILGLMLGGFVAFLLEFGRRSREREDPRYGEFRHLAGELWSDLRKPARWLRRGKKRVASGEG